MADLKVLTALSASSGVAVSGSAGLIVNQGGLTINNGNIVASGAQLTASSVNLAGDMVVGGNLTVRGTTTTVDSTTVNIGDANLNLGTGSTDLSVLSGGGIDLGTTAEVQWRYNNSSTAWKSNVDVDVASTKVYKINGTEVLSETALGSSITDSSLTSVGTLTSLKVSGATELSGTVALGDAAGDVITVNGQLTASQGVELAAGKGITVNGSVLLAKQETTAGPYEITGAILKDPYGTTNSNTFVRVGHISGSGEEYDKIDIQVNSGASLVLDPTQGQLSAGGGSLTVSDTTSSLKSNGLVEVNANGNGEVRLGDGSDIVTFKYNGSNFGGSGFLNLGTVLDDISGSLGSNAGISATSYYSLRSVVVGEKESGNSTVEFKLSGSAAASGDTTRTPTGRQITGLSSSVSAADLVAKLQDMSFDVALRNGPSSTWTNDLVSVTLAASAADGAGLYWPLITVDAPAADNGIKIRLIAVNEKDSVIA